MDFDPGSIAARLAGKQRVLLFGAPGTGKSTLAAKLAAEFAQRRIGCACASSDPGSPAFGVPGAVSLALWTANGWVRTHMEPLCSLDAARFRLPLIQALGRLMKHAPQQQLILLDAPGVVRGAAAPELLAGMVESAGIDAILVLGREEEATPLEQELRALGLAVFTVRAAAEARRPTKIERDRRRTALWDKYLDQAREYRIDLDRVALMGAPPPPDVPSSWTGRQVAFINGRQCAAFGEVIQLDSNILRARLRGDPGSARTLLIRDAARHADGLLRTAQLFREDILPSPPPDMSGAYLRAPFERGP